MLRAAAASAGAAEQRATATGFDGRQSYAHTSDTSQILPRSWGLAVRELLQGLLRVMTRRLTVMKLVFILSGEPF